VLAAGPLAVSAQAAPGDLDLGFGSNGKVLTDFGSSSIDQALAVALQPDGKIVAAGGSGSDFALARYNADGSLDSSFGSGGKVLTDFGSSSIDGARAVALQPDGRIVAAGTSRAGGSFDFALARYNADGSLDPGFGSGGKVLTDIGSSSFDQALAIALQPDGKIVAAGNGGFALARYNADGSLDSSFGSGGKVLTDAGISNLAAIALQPDGKIVAAGESLAAGPLDFALARYNADGSLDSSFGSGGKVLTNLGSLDGARAVVVQVNGKIVAAGYSFAGGSRDFALVRYNADGSLDPGFGSGGKVLTDIGSSSFDAASAAVLQPDGKIVAAGSIGLITSDFALVRYLGDPTNRPPDCSGVTATPDLLWPPNHKLRLVSLNGATDPDGDPVTLTVTTVVQDEPPNDGSPGDTSPDVQPATHPNEILLRAERSGSGDGRVYRVSFTASDGAGGSCSGTVTVGVPHDSSAGPPKPKR
jgi:uncharacterized delta-60 repeat protein